MQNAECRMQNYRVLRTAILKVASFGMRKCAKKNNVEKSEPIIPVCPWANREGDRSSLDKFERYKNFGWYISVLMMYGRNGGGLPRSLFTSLMSGDINSFC